MLKGEIVAWHQIDMIAFKIQRGKMIRRYFSRMLFVAATICTIHATLCAQAAVALPELTFKRLMNDLQVIVAETPESGDDLTIGLIVRYGSAFDLSGKGGTAYLLSQMFMRGTLDKSAKDIQDELTDLGASVEIQVNWDGYRFLLHGHSSKFERSLLLLQQIVSEAQFTDDDFAAAKKTLLEQLQKSEDPRQEMRYIFESELFKGTTYGRNLKGSAQSVQSLNSGDIKLFYRKYFTPNAAALMVAGNVKGDAVLPKATRIWGIWVRGEETPYSFLPPRKPASRNIMLQDDPTSPAAQFIMGNLWPQRDDPAYYPAMLAARILQTRLNKALPTSLITVKADGRRLSGPFYLQGQSAAAEARGEIQKILDAVEAMQASPITMQELEDARRAWIDEFNGAQHSAEGVCNTMLDSELYRLGTNYATSFPELIRRYDLEVVGQAAKDWIFPGGVIIIVRGPISILKPALEPLAATNQVNP
jgi:zinc protease